MTKKWSYAFDVAFECVSDKPWESLTADELLAALEHRVKTLRLNPGEVLEAVGAPFDSCEWDEAMGANGASDVGSL